MLIKIVGAVLVVAVVLVGGAVVRNDVPLFGAPGLGKRLLTYLSSNTAATSPDHEFPELRTRPYPRSPDEMLERVATAATGLGWTVAGSDTVRHTLHAVVATPWLRFKDDVRVSLEGSPDGVTLVNVRSGSRIGRADYGANAGHIIELYRAIEESL